MTFSCHVASHVTESSCCTSLHDRPGSWHLGGALSLPTLMATRSGSVRCFTTPVRGCLPLPLKREGGSILKLPTFSTWPSNNAKPDFRSCLSFSSFVAFFSASEADLRIAFCLSRCSEMRVKSHPLKLLMVCELPRAFEKSSQKFFWKISRWPPLTESCGPSSGIDA